MSLPGPENKKYAIKIIDKESLMSQKNIVRKKLGRVTHHDNFQNILNEILILGSIDHINVVKLVEVIDDQRYPQLYIVLEYAEKGEVLQYDADKNRFVVRNSDIKYLPETDIKRMMRQIVNGLNYCKIKSTLQWGHS